MTNSSTPFDPFHWLKKHYLIIFTLVLLFYILLAFLAPILLNAGYPQLGKLIYRGFSNFCHQYAHRSWFLFGEQAHYPIESRGSALTIFEVFDIPLDHPELSREIIGNERAGYKVAVCQRDVALYGAMLLFTLIYIASGKRIAQLPFLLWVILAVAPMGVDGLWQLAGSYGLFSSAHESTPLIRSITGAMFGFFSGWILLPAIERSIQKEQSNT